jgi:hypothetical protein
MIGSWLVASVMCGGAIGSVGPAEKLQVSASILAGTGISLAGVARKTYAARSPTFLLAEVGFVHPQLQWLEFAPTIALEIEGRIGVGLMPKLRARLPGKRVRVWAVGALPIFFAPYSLLGVQGGAGLSVALHPRVALLAEFTGTGYVWGSDLMKGAALAKLDQTFGVRMNF